MIVHIREVRGRCDRSYIMQVHAYPEPGVPVAGPHLHIDRDESMGQRSRQPQHQASPNDTPDPVRQHSSSSSESCCRRFVAVQQASGDGAADALTARGLAPEADSISPEASR